MWWILLGIALLIYLAIGCFGLWALNYDQGSVPLKDGIIFIFTWPRFILKG